MIVFGKTAPANPGAALNAILLAASARGGDVIKLSTRTYALETPLILQPRVTLDLNGSTLEPDFSPGVELADDPSNALIKVAGVITETVDTTLSARAKRSATSITVTSATGIVAGQYLEILGNNYNEEGTSEGPNLVSVDTVQVHADYVSGTTIPLVWPTHVWHNAGHTVKSLDGSPFDVVIGNGAVRAPGGTLAVGIHGSHAQRLKISGMEFEGFSRAAICLDRGTREFRVHDIYGRGEINSLVFVDSAHRGSVTKTSTASDGLRNHANGVPRGILHVHNDSSGVIFHDANLAHGCVALWIKHGHAIKASKIIAYDFDPGPSYTACVATTEQVGNSFFAIVQTGSTPVDWAAFVADVDLHDITVDSPAVTDVTPSHGVWSFALHDAFGLSADHLKVVNTGKATNIFGIHAKDCQGMLTNTSVRGVDKGLRLEGLGIGAINDYGWAGFINGIDAVSQNAIELEIGASPQEMDGIYISGTGGFIRFDGGAGSIPDLVIRTLGVHDRVYEYVIPAVNKTGATLPTSALYELVELEPAAEIEGIADTPRFRTPTGQSRKMAVLATGPFDYATDGSVMFVAPLPQRCSVKVRAADTVQPGDLLDVDTDDVGATKPAKVNNSSTAPNARAASYKNSDEAEAVVRVTSC